MVIKIKLRGEDLLPARLEVLEDKIRDLLLEEGFERFDIEDGYTGNITREKEG